jgi:hypothetical protein
VAESYEAILARYDVTVARLNQQLAMFNETQHALDAAQGCAEDNVMWWDFSNGSPAIIRTCQPLDNICSERFGTP